MQPRIIPRKEHGISRRQVSPNALRTLYRLRDNGFVAYLVGGCVRDLLLGRKPKDFDIATDAAPGQIKRLFRNCRLIGRRFRLAHLHFSDEILEVSTFRAAAPPEEEETPETEQDRRHPRHLKNEDGMVLRDNVFGTPEEDALRRDFTINALAYNIADGSVIDYTTGLNDLHQRLLRPIGDPFVRFTEDPVRMLRAVRFAASHGLAIEPETWNAVRTLASTISRASAARLFEETLKLFLLGSARPVFDLLQGSGLLEPLFPVFARWLSVDDGRRRMIAANLEYLDRRYREGEAPSALFFLSAFFGPFLEDEALVRHREGVPRQQALDAASAVFLQELSCTVHVPARVGGRLRGILAMQPSLHRMPPRRPAALLNRQDFAEALNYLRLGTETRRENCVALAWWDHFLTEGVPPRPGETAASEAATKRRRRRRRRPRRPVPVAA